MNTDKIQIEKGIPLPSRSNPNKNCLSNIIREMEVGDSIVIPKKISLHTLARQVNAKVATRKISETEVRLWRVA